MPDIPSPHMISDLKSVLRRRGLEPQRTGDLARTLYPHDNWQKIMERHGQFKYHEYFSGEFIIHYMARFEKASFRKVIRQLLRDGRQFVEIEELRRIAGRSTEDYLTYLDRTLLIEREGTRVRLTREINDIGASLEHYVSVLCERELRGASEWSVLLANLPRSGGDFDVLAWLEPSLIYVECKSARPSHISEAEIREFLQRSVELAPDLAILLIDTEDDLTQFVNRRINSVIRQEHCIEDDSDQWITERNDYPRVFYGPRNIYVINSRYTILAQLRRCLQHYYAHVKHGSFYSDDEDHQPNYTGRSLQDRSELPSEDP